MISIHGTDKLSSLKCFIIFVCANRQTAGIVSEITKMVPSKCLPPNNTVHRYIACVHVLFKDKIKCKHEALVEKVDLILGVNLLYCDYFI